MNPDTFKSAVRVSVRPVSTPLGWAYLAATSKGVLACSWPWAEQVPLEKALAGYLPEFPPGNLKVAMVPEPLYELNPDGVLDQAEEALNAYFNKQLSQIGEVPREMGFFTPWQQKVYDVVAGIPAGEVRSYGWVAEQCGKPGSSRAVGRALGVNPLPLFIPCHRVIYADGRLGNYSCGGPALKRSLLFHEQPGGEFRCGNGTVKFRD